jgi:hypothetical protein
MARPAIGQNLHGIQEDRQLLYLVQHDEPSPMIQPADGIGAKSQAFVRIVERVVNGRGPLRGRQQVAHQRRLPGLPGAGKDRDRPPGKPRLEDRKQGSRMEGHGGYTLSSSMQKFNEYLQRQ